MDPTETEMRAPEAVQTGRDNRQLPAKPGRARMAGLDPGAEWEGMVAQVWKPTGERGDEQGLVSGTRAPKFEPQVCDAKTVKETAGYDEYVRRCGRTGAARPPPTRYNKMPLWGDSCG